MPPPPNTPQSNTTFFNTVMNQNAHNNPPAATPPRPTRAFEQQPPAFSATQRNAQARSKNYNASPANKILESYEQRQRRDEAASILESMEMLIWYAAARNESIPQTRQHYQNIVLGIEDDAAIEWREEWEVAAEERDKGIGVASPRSAKGKEKERERGKKRVSSGHMHG